MYAPQYANRKSNRWFPLSLVVSRYSCCSCDSFVKDKTLRQSKVFGTHLSGPRIPSSISSPVYSFVEKECECVQRDIHATNGYQVPIASFICHSCQSKEWNVGLGATLTERLMENKIY